MFLCTGSSLFFGTGFGVSYSMYKSNIDATILLFSQWDRQNSSGILNGLKRQQNNKYLFYTVTVCAVSGTAHTWCIILCLLRAFCAGPPFIVRGTRHPLETCILMMEL